MSLSGDLIAWGPTVTVALILLLVSKELLDNTSLMGRRLRWGLTALIVPLLLVFFVQIAILVMGA